MDRNLDTMQVIVIVMKSLSARRAWIEIVDWLNAGSLSRSLSARRAWIEIRAKPLRMCHRVDVALRKESVDRNWYCLGTRVSETRRSPQGERG